MPVCGLGKILVQGVLLYSRLKGLLVQGKSHRILSLRAWSPHHSLDSLDKTKCTLSYLNWTGDKIVRKSTTPKHHSSKNRVAKELMSTSGRWNALYAVRAAVDNRETNGITWSPEFRPHLQHTSNGSTHMVISLGKPRLSKSTLLSEQACSSTGSLV